MIQENFIRLFEDSIRYNWEKNAYSDFGTNKTLTYGEVGKEVAKLHLLFEQCDVKKNDKIALIGKNNTNWAIVYVASVTYGAIIVPILQDFNANDIHHILNHSESKLLFVSDFVWENLEEDRLLTVRSVFSLENFSEIVIINEPPPQLLEDTTEEISEIDAPILSYKVSHEYIEKLFADKYHDGFTKDNVRYVDKHNSEIVCLNYTSGTTGFSKGVMLSGNSLAGNITFGIRTELLKSGYQVVSFLPLAHTYGCAFDFLTATCTGVHVHFLGRTPAAKILLKAFAEVRPNVIFTVPLIIEKIYKKQIQPLLDKPSMRWVLKIPFLDQKILGQIKKRLIDAFGGNFSQIVVGGAPLNAEVEEFFYKIKFPFTVGYGMTECGPLISYEHKDKFIPKSSGKVLDIMQAKIDSPAPDTGIGEILVKGENVMSGYFKNHVATNDVLDKDGWLHTGDLGTIDTEGNLFIRGRNKTMILSANGQNIYPEEIESRLNNMSFVNESLVIERNGKLVALVTPDYEAADAEGLKQDDLINIMEENRKLLNSMVAAYENVANIQLYPHEFEKTPKKSIKRYLYTSVVK